MTRRKPLRATQATKPDAPALARRKLELLLREHPVGGLSFHPHERLGPFTVDFHCPGARLVLLLVDDEHATEDAAAWLRQNGYRVLAFPVGEALNNPRSVLEAIARSFELRIVPPQI